MRIVFNPSAEQSTNTINTIFADLGGAPMIDTANRRYVFDHHCDGRFAMMSACGQVFMAIQQGLTLDADTTVCVNHTDADSVLSVWLLQHPERVRTYRGLLWRVIESVSRLDNYGPAGALPGEPFLAIHYDLAPARGETDSEAVFLNRLAKAEELWQDNGLEKLAPARPEFPGKAYAFTPDGEALPVDSSTPGFDHVYALGGMGVIFGDRGMVTIGKLPFFPAKSFKTGLIDALNAAEVGGGWGGADSIMGSPRPNGTALSQDYILSVIQRFICDVSRLYI